jgi:hypothetical protein
MLETNSYLRPNFQLVSISNRHVSFYSPISHNYSIQYINKYISMALHCCFHAYIIDNMRCYYKFCFNAYKLSVLVFKFRSDSMSKTGHHFLFRIDIGM